MSQTRRQRRKDRREKRNREAATILPPEGVPLHLPIAGVGVRIAAQATDIAITGAFAIALWIMISLSGMIGIHSMAGLAALLFFAIRVPYYVLSELAWNGQTIGKRLMKIKVVAHSGGSLTTHALVLRNIMKEAEVFLPATLVITLDTSSPIASTISFLWVCMALLIPLTNPHRMRLGDMLASTHVIHLPQPILLSDVARAAAPVSSKQKAFTFMPHQLDHYGRFELQTLETFLREKGSFKTPEQVTRRRETLASIIEKVRKKIDYADRVQPADHQRFLQDFYNAQRAHLERRQLFGDKRADKFHKENESPDPKR